MVALVREGSDVRGLEGLDVEIVRGDVCDAESVERAMRPGTTHVFHLAAPYLNWARDPKTIVGRLGPQDEVDVTYSVGFGGGPSWMRSPRYAPINVKRTPMAAMMM